MQNDTAGAPSREFGSAEGETIHEISLGGPDCTLRASVIDWGATLRDLRLDGHAAPLILGFERLEDYLAHSSHFGATAGRYANRIGRGRFMLDGKVYQLTLNQQGRHHLHGGYRGFGRRPWRIVDHDPYQVTLELVSRAGEEGYPGELRARCRYRLEAPATLSVELSAETDAPTVVNLAHHSYFNLDDSASVRRHRLQLAADAYLPVDDDLIPTGELRPVDGTPFDFRRLRPLASGDGTEGEIAAEIKNETGTGTGPETRNTPDAPAVYYDHNFVLAAAPRPEPAYAARLESPSSGLALEVWTTEPGLQVYDGNGLKTPPAGLEGRRYGRCAGLCLEAQRFPDSPNRTHFGDPTLRPGVRYRQLTEYRFLAAG